MAIGYRSVSSSDERQVGVLTPAAALLMMLAAGIAHGWAGVGFVLVLTPLFMVMALLGGALASVSARPAKRLRAWHNGSRA